MVKKIVLILTVLVLCFLSLSLHKRAGETDGLETQTETPAPTESDTPEPSISAQITQEEEIAADFPTREEIGQKYKDIAPALWGEDIDGIISKIPTDEKIIALTFDACGWGQGSGYDEELIEFLISENIPATLFISGKWIEDNPQKLEYLAEQDNFEIENHGYLHKPLSVNGRQVYGKEGTSSPEEVFDEIEENAQVIYELTGRRPVFFRTGTAYYDDVAVEIANELGQRIAGFTIAADGGATFSEAQILGACSDPQSGAILLFHMNRPESETFEGVRSLCEILSEKGFRFVKMEDCDY